MYFFWFGFSCCFCSPLPCRYYETGNYLYQKVLQANDKGDHVPLWGTCMGFQFLNLLTSQVKPVFLHICSNAFTLHKIQNQSVLERNAFDSEDLSLALNLTSGTSNPCLSSDLIPLLTRKWLRTKPGWKSSRIFGEAPEKVTNIISQQVGYHYFLCSKNYLIPDILIAALLAALSSGRHFKSSPRRSAPSQFLCRPQTELFLSSVVHECRSKGAIQRVAV